MKNPAPANLAGMNQRVGICGNPIKDCAGAPRLIARFNGHVNHDRRPDDMVARNWAHETAVERIAAIVAHHEIAVRRNFERKNVRLTSEIATPQSRLSGVGGANRVVFAKARSIDVDAAVMNIDNIAGQADDALDDVRSVAGIDGPEDDDLLAFGTAPKRFVNVGKGNAGVIAEATHEQMIADEQRILHGSRRNHARLADRSVDEKQNQNDPEPCNRFAANFL